MKILVDECVDTRLIPHLIGFDARTVHDQRWAGFTNGKLLALAQGEFDVFLTVDRNLAFQQQLPKFSIAVVLMHSRSNRITDLLELIPELIAAIPTAKPGVVTHVGR